MGGGAPGGGGAAPAEQMDEDPSAGSGNLAAMTEEEQIALAIQMSMAESAGVDETPMEGLLMTFSDKQKHLSSRNHRFPARHGSGLFAVLELVIIIIVIMCL